MQDLDQLPAAAEQEHGPELRVDGAAEDDLVPVEADHRLDRDAEEVPGAGLFLDRGPDCGEGLAHRLGVAVVEANAAVLRLVREGFGVELDGHRKPHRSGQGRGLVRRGRDPGFDRRDSVACEQLLRLELAQDRPSRQARVADQPLDGGALRRAGRRVVRGGGRLVDAAEVFAVPPHVAEGPGGGVGMGEGGYAGAVQDAFARRDGGAPHPARQDRPSLEFRESLEMLGRERRIGHGLRGEDHEQTVAVAVARGDLDRALVESGRRIAQDVDRVPPAPVRGEDAVEGRDGFAAERRRLASVGHQLVGREHRGTAGVGHDRQARPPWARLPGEDLGHVEQVADCPDAQDPRAPEGGVEHLVAAGEGARVRGGRLRRGLAAPGLQHDDRLAERHLARGREERPGVADRFHVDDDAARAAVVAEVLDQAYPSNSSSGVHRTGGS